jgi:hypothetical protein
MPYAFDAKADPIEAERESVDEGEVRLPIALRDTMLKVEEAQEIRRILDDPNYPTHAGKQVALADEDMVIKR